MGSAEFLKKENEVLIAKNIAQGHIAGGFQSHHLNQRLFEAKTQSTKKIVDIWNSISVLLLGLKTAVLSSKIYSWHGQILPRFM